MGGCCRREAAGLLREHGQPPLDFIIEALGGCPDLRRDVLQVSAVTMVQSAESLIPGPEPVVVAVADLSDEQIEQLKNDPQLVVRLFEQK